MHLLRRPETGVPLAATVHQGRPVWASGSDGSGRRSPGDARIVPGRSACAEPLRRGGRVIR
ncbi:hypothetical protein [Kitasatospora brasiliensis]|uniref:hypothetical protein n=1 Tax=Kitasatospora brasiliensis TaxID=3058040 RepID=UPI00292FD877|nr:hypothetical protein [Kitasatospora sp. K002]